MTEQEILNILQAEKPYLRKQFGLLSIGLFGSYAKGTQGPESKDVPSTFSLNGAFGFKCSNGENVISAEERIRKTTGGVLAKNRDIQNCPKLRQKKKCLTGGI